MNKKLAYHMSVNWFKYIAVLIIVPAFFGTIFDSMSKPKANEQVIVSFFGDKMDISEINDILYGDKGNFTEQPLKNVYIDLKSNDDQMMNQLLMAELESSDIIVLTEDMITENAEGERKIAPSALFRFLGAESEPDLLKNAIGGKADGLEYFYDKDANGTERPIGIYLNTLNKEGEKNLFEQYYTGEQRCVAFICPKSVNIGEMFDTHDGTDTAALDTLLYLIGDR